MNTNIKGKLGVLAIGLVLSLVLGLVAVKSFSSFVPQNVTENGDINVTNYFTSQQQAQNLGAITGTSLTPNYLDAGEWTQWNDGQFDDVEIEDDVWIAGDITATGTATFNGASSFSALNFKESYEAITASNTITVAESGKTFYLSGATSTQTLPATSTAAGTVYRFVVDGSVTGNITIVSNDGSNIIDGTLIVAGAVVDCDAEDTITIVADGENVGDFVELRSNGTKWFIGASGALTASKMTCTAT